jgi:hypothetical protein
MTKTKVKKIGVLQTAKISAIIFFLISSIIVVPMMLIMVIIGGFSGETEIWIKILPILLMPILYPIIGFLMTALWCWLYNVLAKRIGGIEIEFEAMEE